MSCSSRSMPRSRYWGSQGISMVEATISIVIVGTMMVAGLSAVGASARVQQRMTDSGRGVLLAQQLMSEIMQQSYEEPVDTPSFGRELTEGAVDQGTVEHIKDIVNANSSVRQWHRLRTRMVGREVFLDLHILVDPDLNIAAAHEIADSLENDLHEQIPRPVNITVHIEPDIPALRK